MIENPTAGMRIRMRRVSWNPAAGGRTGTITGPSRWENRFVVHLDQPIRAAYAEHHDIHVRRAEMDLDRPAPRTLASAWPQP